MGNYPSIIRHVKGLLTHDSLNPKRIIPRGPLDLDFTT